MSAALAFDERRTPFIFPTLGAPWALWGSPTAKVLWLGPVLEVCPLPCERSSRHCARWAGSSEFLPHDRMGVGEFVAERRSRGGDNFLRSNLGEWRCPVQMMHQSRFDVLFDPLPFVPDCTDAAFRANGCCCLLWSVLWWSWGSCRYGTVASRCVAVSPSGWNPLPGHMPNAGGSMGWSSSLP